MSSPKLTTDFNREALPSGGALPAQGADLWQADLDLFPTEMLPLLRTWLSPEELTRVERLIPALPRRRTLVMRGLLRWLLASYLQSTPAAVDFTYAAHGKPLVVPPPGRTAVQFNVSHSQNLGWLAVARCEVGLDVEKQRENLAMAALVERYFSARERTRFRELSAPEQTPWFFRCWTRKEALLKACGLGIQLPLDELDVGGDEATPVLTLEGIPWQLLDVTEGHASASLAVPLGKVVEVRRGKVAW